MTKRSRLPEPPQTDPTLLTNQWGISIDPDLLGRALIHRSYSYEAGGIDHNERLEFLGDSVLSIVIADQLYRDHPQATEAELSRMRAATVSQEPLAMVARRLGLGDFIYLGRGEDKGGGRGKDSILSDTVEALIGATFLTHGYEPTARVVRDRLGFLLGDAVVRGQMQDWKTTLTEYARDHKEETPVYVVESTGPDHERTFVAKVSFGADQLVVGTAEGTSKKHAENMAARDAVARLDPSYPVQ